MDASDTLAHAAKGCAWKPGHKKIWLFPGKAACLTKVRAAWGMARSNQGFRVNEVVLRRGKTVLDTERSAVCFLFACDDAIDGEAEVA
jgi:hypothetical protein